MLALDGSVSPYLPAPEVLEVIRETPARDPTELAMRLRARLAFLHGVPPDRIALFPNDRTRLDRPLALRPGSPLVIYAPTQFEPPSHSTGTEIVQVDRTSRFGIEAPQVEATAPGAVSFVTTPNDPTGNAIGLTTVAQLAKRSSLLLLDERSAEMQHRSMIPLVSEFDSIVLLRSFDDWAGLRNTAPGYAITTAAIAAVVDRSEDLTASGIHAALAAVSHASLLDAIANRVRLERLRLYRMLRKLNFLCPLPSTAGYVLAEVTRGERDTIAAALRARNITVFAPPQHRLRSHLRFAAISPATTRLLQLALLEIARQELP